MIAPARAIGVELRNRHLMGLQIFARRAVFLDGARRGNVVGGDGVAEQRKHARILNRLDLFRLFGHAFEIGRVRHIGRSRPAIGLAVASVDRLPFFIALEDVGIARGEHFCGHMFAHDLGDFLVGRPDVFEEDIIAVLILAERIGGEVDVHRAGERIGDHERRRSEIVCAHVLRYAAFEVAVAGKNRCDREIVVIDGFRDRRRQGAGITDAGCAAIAHKIEAERVEIIIETGGGEIVRDDLAAGGK